ncbi:MAG: heme ABC exporter ATP-binding protein CcmA [Anaerolineales bacterium]|nr:heme ABC exporter ATP-binding protein CcmA [Anaerolineales bacterium]MCB8950619.1 heme ABC exporter ATP-binding protein CcmA [Ardenticatenales bacterium]
MIHIAGLVKNFGLNPVLRGVDLRVAEGEFVALVGANGAGKTTLLRIVATLTRPGGGVVEVGGWMLPQHAGKIRRHIGLVSHHSLLYNDLTAAENLAFYARLYGLENREQLVLSALKGVGLSARQRDPVRTFSRGMLQRLTIARATLHQPEVLLLDEPYTGLDQEASGILEGLLEQEKARGRTILMITHDFARGLNLCDRIAILNRGKIVTEVARAAISQGDFLTLYTDITRATPAR